MSEYEVELWATCNEPSPLDAVRNVQESANELSWIVRNIDTGAKFQVDPFSGKTWPLVEDDAARICPDCGGATMAQLPDGSYMCGKCYAANNPKEEA